MLKKLIKFVLQIPKKQTSKSKEEINMVKTALKKKRKRISSSVFNKHASIGEIRRHGKEIVLVNKGGSFTPASHKIIRELCEDVFRESSSAKIRTNGLSKAQVGRIAADIKDASNADVYIRKVPLRRVRKLQPVEFEILLTDGKKYEME